MNQFTDDTSTTTTLVAWFIHQHNRHYSNHSCCDLVSLSHHFKFRVEQNITLSSRRRHTASLSFLNLMSLCSKPLLSYHRDSCSSSSSIPFTSIDLSFPKPNYLPSKQRCYINVSRNYSKSGSGDGGGDIIREGAETVSETYNNLQHDVVVYSNISIDGQASRVMTIKVKNEDYIDSIIDEIKTKNKARLSSVNPAQIELFESIEQETPLHALDTWSHSVTWGTKR